MNQAGTMLRVWKMPIEWIGVTKKHKTLDLAKLNAILGEIHCFPAILCGLENPTTRPGEGAEQCFRFGRQVGALEASLTLHKFDYRLVSPSLWKSRLGLPGKLVDPKSVQAAAYFEAYYPAHKHLVRGPLGGLLDGPLDALLIASFMRENAGLLDTLNQSVSSPLARLPKKPRRKRLLKPPS